MKSLAIDVLDIFKVDAVCVACAVSFECLAELFPAVNREAP